MLKTIEHRLKRLMDLLGAISATLLILLVVLMAYNVIGRYAFRNSSIGLEELSWHLYAAIFLLGIPYALRTKSHVRVDLLYENFKPKTQALVDLVGCVIFLFPFCLVVIWAGWEFAASSYQLGTQPDSLSSFFKQLFNGGIGERSQDPGGLLNRWIIKGVIPLSFLFLLLSTIAFFIERLNVFLEFDSSRSDTSDSD